MRTSAPVFLRRSAASSRPSWLRSNSAIRAPFSAMASAIDRPSPLAEPVMIATLPEISNRLGILIGLSAACTPVLGSLRRQSSVDDQLRAYHVSQIVTGKKAH